VNEEPGFPKAWAAASRRSVVPTIQDQLGRWGPGGPRGRSPALDITYCSSGIMALLSVFTRADPAGLIETGRPRVCSGWPRMGAHVNCVGSLRQRDVVSAHAGRAGAVVAFVREPPPPPVQRRGQETARINARTMSMRRPSCLRTSPAQCVGSRRRP
jgi:hypothetical protein